MKLKCKCGCEKMFIDQRSDCGSCEHNGWYNEEIDEYSYEDPPEGVERNECYEESNCNMGHNYNEGCYLTTCSECGKMVEHIPCGYE